MLYKQTIPVLVDIFSMNVGLLKCSTLNIYLQNLKLQKIGKIFLRVASDYKNSTDLYSLQICKRLVNFYFNQCRDCLKFQSESLIMYVRMMCGYCGAMVTRLTADPKDGCSSHTKNIFLNNNPAETVKMGVRVTLG